MFHFWDGELYMWIWSLLEQHFHNENETSGDSFYYGKADEFLKLLLPKLNSSAWPQKIIALFEM